MKQQLKKGAYELILTGRTPCAAVRFSGSTQAPALCGTAECYETPLGTVICAELSGLPQRDAAAQYEVFLLRLGEETIPLYARKGNAWCAIMTRASAASGLLRETVTIVRGASEPIGVGTVIPTLQPVYGT